MTLGVIKETAQPRLSPEHNDAWTFSTSECNDLRRIQDCPEVVPNQKGVSTYYLDKIYRKLHENEEN